MVGWSNIPTRVKRLFEGSNGDHILNTWNLSEGPNFGAYH